MGKASRWSGVFWTLFALFVGYHSYQLGLGDLNTPGPGFFFFWTAVFVGGLSLIDLWRARKAGAGQTGERANLVKVVLVLAALLAYVLLIEPLGFIPVTLLFFLFIMAAVEKKRWPFAVLVSLAVTAAAYLVFETALRSQLPKGVLDSFRF